MLERVITPSIRISEMKDLIKKVSGASKLYQQSHELTETDAQIQHLHKPAEHGRPMTASFSRGIIPLSDIACRDGYLNYLKQIRFGRLLEDLDTFAVYTAYKHTDAITGDADPKTNRAKFSIVTGLVDRIMVKRSANSEADLHLSGFVSWVGKSSMEVTMNVDQENTEHGLDRLCTARFVMVAIDAVTKAPTAVTPLAPANDQEKTYFQKGIEHQERRLKVRQQSLFKAPPNAEESALIHNMYLRTLDPNKHSFKERFKPSSDVWMKDTSRKGLIICHPENRNIYGKIFGGFLMRTAYELAWAEAWTFSKTRPQCVAVDDIIFRRPVEVGSLLYLHQSIGYTDGDLMQARVTAEVTDRNDPDRRELANLFNFTFRARLQPGRGHLPKIYPVSYGESMLLIDSRRRLMSTKERMGEQKEQQSEK